MMINQIMLMSKKINK